ncbi:hypothetical protein E2C01_089291 [Portunus trituberculatus]|uniref:Uncharacterized protein n=1 Tax=Portunus trituberculatus TaxID=210409 RepID=A0A5B7JM13_PORTR|nr:hypothetical protein [Portunus trituberculatus]
MSLRIRMRRKRERTAAVWSLEVGLSFRKDFLRNIGREGKEERGARRTLDEGWSFRRGQSPGREAFGASPPLLPRSSTHLLSLCLCLGKTLPLHSLASSHLFRPCLIPRCHLSGPAWLDWLPGPLLKVFTWIRSGVAVLTCHIFYSHVKTLRFTSTHIQLRAPQGYSCGEWIVSVQAIWQVAALETVGVLQ